uniref:Adiponectin receptor protein n=1 Tax=Plectus sambesii TaxID=2011161 RepID=A0A914VMM5_9BILA
MVSAVAPNGDNPAASAETVKGTSSEPLLPESAVEDVLSEARQILMGGGSKRMAENEDVLEESTTVEVVQSSPKRLSQPFEIIVRHSKVVAEQNTDDDEDDDENFREAAEEFESETHKLKKSENGPLHSRQWSGSTDGGDHLSMTISEDDDGHRRHRTVRYRLRHQNDDGHGDRVVDARDGDDEENDDDELEIEMDEEEIIRLPGLESAKKGKRHIVKRFWEARWKAQHFDFLPDWLQDNEFLHTGHRPPLPSFGACFKSIFALHSETGNIWTHMFGCAAFIGTAAWFLTRPATEVQWQEKMIFSIFFLSAITCLGMSFAFHTVSCHSISVGKLFSKLDYVGISLLIMGSFVPWIFYGFYCRQQPKITYIAMILVFGVAAIIVSLWDKFSTPRFRPLRAGVFCAMGLSGVVPAVHFMITDGLRTLIDEAAFHWLLLMAFLYLAGAALYATRTPERFFPGKCDLWFQSHQLFHMCVVVAAFVHYHGISEMAVNRLQGGSCPEQRPDHF